MYERFLVVTTEAPADGGTLASVALGCGDLFAGGGEVVIGLGGGICGGGGGGGSGAGLRGGVIGGE